MKSLVSLDKNNRAFTTTLIIAKGVKIEHRAVIILLKRHSNRQTLSSFEMFKVPTKGRPVEYAELTELQATFLITLMKNSDTVLDFKEALSKEFFRMKEQLAKIAAQQTNQQWIETRNRGKIDRKVETDSIKLFIDYAKEQGGSVKGCDMYYSNISKMENKALFIIEQKYKNLRDVLGLVDLLTVQQADRIVAKALQDGMDNKLNYKDIYKLAKERVTMFADIRGQSIIGYLTHDEEKLT